MSSEFDQVIDRRASDSIKWNFYAPDVLPMWVADMDFAVPQAVQAALQQRVAHGLYGYARPSDALRQVICERLQRLYQWTVLPEALLFLPGHVVGLNVACRAIGAAGDGVLLQPPVYYPFMSAVANQQREVQFAPLARSTSGSIISFAADVDALRAAITPRTKLFLLCNPHNPAGLMYERAVLEEMAQVCLEHKIVMVADEIHCDLVLERRAHVPLATLGPEVAARSITLMAPSKTFNLAGMVCGFAIVPDEALRAQLEAGMLGLTGQVNAMGLVACEAAYLHGAEWLARLNCYLAGNRDYLVDFVTKRLPGVRTTIPAATYLAWLDFTEYALQPTPHDFLVEHAHVAANDGGPFGPDSAGFARINFACPRATLQRGLEQIEVALAAQRAA